MLRPDENLTAVKAFLERAQRPVSEGDVAAGCGIDISSAKRNLYGLMRTHHAVLQPHDDGMLVYDFGDTLRPLDAPSFTDHMKTVGRWLLKAFTVVYKASLAVVLVVYAVAFIVLIVAAALALSAAAEDEGPLEFIGHMVLGVFRAIFDFAFFVDPVVVDVAYTSRTDRHGYTYKEPVKESEFSKARKKKKAAKAGNDDDNEPAKKGFITSVYDFVLGPARVAVDDRHQHKEVAAFVRQNDGLLTIGHIQALSGMPRPEAEAFFARFVAEQDGHVDITDDGVLLAHFDELMLSTSTDADTTVEYFWDEYEAPHKITGNSFGMNFGVAAVAAFNLFCGVFILDTPELLGASWSMWLGLIPTVIFSLFFVLPLVRAPYVWWQNHQHHKRNLKRRLYKAIFKGQGSQPTFADVVAQANAVSTTEERLHIDGSAGLIKDVAQEINVDVDVDVNKGDKLMLQLAQLQRELDAQREQRVTQEAVVTTR